MGFLGLGAPKAPKAQTVAAPQSKVEMDDVNSAKLAADTQRKKRGFASTNLDGMGGPSGIKQTLG
jgi:hypothetical protein